MEGQKAKRRACLSALPGSGPRSATTFLSQRGHCLLPNMGERERPQEDTEHWGRWTGGLSRYFPDKPLPTSISQTQTCYSLPGPQFSHL